MGMKCVPKGLVNWRLRSAHRVDKRVKIYIIES